MCLKIAYPSRRQAEISATLQARRHGKTPMRAYPCPRCNDFHLTSDNDPARWLPRLLVLPFVTEEPDPPPPKPLPVPPERQLLAHQWYERNKKVLKSRKRFLKPQ